MTGVVIKRITVPKNFLNPAQLQKAIDNSLTQTAKAIKVDFDVTTRTWSKRPAFTIRRKPGKIFITTDDPIYGLVDEGARAHPITPKKKGGVLIFRGGYKAKTRVRQIRSTSGGARGNVTRINRVAHPGFQGRELADTIAEKWDERYPKQWQRAVAPFI